MKRFWIGVVFLVALLSCGIWVTITLENTIGPIVSLLEQASQAATEEDFARSGALVMQANNQWMHSWHKTAALSDHSCMEELDALYEEVQVYLSMEEASDLAAACARLARLTKAFPEAHSPAWWNLL
jgi:hypothetical protein